MVSWAVAKQAIGSHSPPRSHASPATSGPKTEGSFRHEVEFYSDGASFLNGFARFAAPALAASNAVIVIATESHRNGLLSRFPRERPRYRCCDSRGALSLSVGIPPVFLNSGARKPLRSSVMETDEKVASAERAVRTRDLAGSAGRSRADLAMNPKRSAFGTPLQYLLVIVSTIALAPGDNFADPFVNRASAVPAQDQAAKIPPDQLDSLVAPIALYPDPLLAQALAASTYPLELIQLQQWLTKHAGLKDKELADAVAKQPWDASIQAMAALPDVVKRLTDDIQWTTDLG